MHCRDFLRLGNPACCAAEEDCTTRRQDSSGPTYAVIDESGSPRHELPRHVAAAAGAGGSVPLTRVKCLVSMTTPRDVRLHGASITPSFVEFDMSCEGFGCLYLPSLAPQAPQAPSVVGAGMIVGSDQSVVGGIGSGEKPSF